MKSVNEIPGPGNNRLNSRFRLHIILIAFKCAIQYVHGLVIEVIVDRDLATGLNREITQSVFRISGTVIPAA